jgi:hypothetical protein
MLWVVLVGFLSIWTMEELGKKYEQAVPAGSQKILNQLSTGL